jgi:hypothetical protein
MRQYLPIIIAAAIELALLAVLAVALRRQRHQAALRARAERLATYAHHLAEAYSLIGDEQMQLRSESSLYPLTKGGTGLEIYLYLSAEDARRIRQRLHDGRESLLSWARRVATGTAIYIPSEDYRITLSAPLTPLVTISHHPGHEPGIAVTPQHNFDFKD